MGISPMAALLLLSIDRKLSPRAGTQFCVRASLACVARRPCNPNSLVGVACLEFQSAPKQARDNVNLLAFPEHIQAGF